MRSCEISPNQPLQMATIGQACIEQPTMWSPFTVDISTARTPISKTQSTLRKRGQRDFWEQRTRTSSTWWCLLHMTAKVHTWSFNVCSFFVNLLSPLACCLCVSGRTLTPWEVACRCHFPSYGRWVLILSSHKSQRSLFTPTLSLLFRNSVYDHLKSHAI